MRGSILGIEIGNKNIKIIEAKKKGKSCELGRQAILPTPKGSIEDGYLIDKEQIASCIKDLMIREGLKSKKVCLLLESSKIITREIEVTGSHNKYLKELLRYQIQDYLPIEPKDYEIDFEMIEEIEKEGLKGLKVLVVAAPKDLVEEYIELAEKLKLKIHLISVASSGLGKVLGSMEMSDIGEKETTLVIDIGAKSTHLSILTGCTSRLSSSITFGSEEINERIQEEFQEADEQTIEEFKQRYGAIYKKEEIEHEDFYGNYISLLIKEDIEKRLIVGIQDFLQFYHAKYPQHPVEKAFVIGGGSNLKWVKEYIEDTLCMIIETPNKGMPYLVNLVGVVAGA